MTRHLYLGLALAVAACASPASTRPVASTPAPTRPAAPPIDPDHYWSFVGDDDLNENQWAETPHGPLTIATSKDTDDDSVVLVWIDGRGAWHPILALPRTGAGIPDGMWRTSFHLDAIDGGFQVSGFASNGQWEYYTRWAIAWSAAKGTFVVDAAPTTSWTVAPHLLDESQSGKS